MFRLPHVKTKALEGQPTADEPRKPYLTLNGAGCGLVLDTDGDLILTTVDSFGDFIQQRISKDERALLLEWLCMVSAGNGAVMKTEITTDSSVAVGGIYSTERGWTVRSGFLSMSAEAFKSQSKERK